MIGVNQVALGKLKMKPYQVEFRQKILDTYLNEQISIAKVAKRFCVAKSFVQKIIKQWRDTGDKPRPTWNLEFVINLR